MQMASQTFISFPTSQRLRQGSILSFRRISCSLKVRRYRLLPRWLPTYARKPFPFVNQQLAHTRLDSEGTDTTGTKSIFCPDSIHEHNSQAQLTAFPP